VLRVTPALAEEIEHFSPGKNYKPNGTTFDFVSDAPENCRNVS
jgi:hypothetical protein